MEEAIVKEDVLEILNTLNKGEPYNLLEHKLEFKDLNIKVDAIDGYAAAEVDYKGFNDVSVTVNGEKYKII